MDAENYACRKMRLIFGACRYPSLRSSKNLFVVIGQKIPLLLPMVG